MTAKFDELTLRVEWNSDGTGYQVWAKAGAKEARDSFENPFTSDDMESVRRTEPARHARDVQVGQAQRRTSAKELGKKLFSAIYRGALRDLLTDILPGPGSKHSLRLRLRLDPPEIAHLPWELLYGPSGFLALSVQTPVVRHLEHSNPFRPLRIAWPLRVLIVVASPDGHDLLDGEKELEQIRAALGWLERTGIVKVDRLEPPTLDALNSRLGSGKPYHVLHFIGHGTFDSSRREGMLLFENDSGKPRYVSGDDLAVALGVGTMRLVVLNACRGAQAAADDPFTGVAQCLVRKRIPAVVAMQDLIEDTLAVAFASNLYRSLALSMPVDWAVTKARIAMHGKSEGEMDWANPVLFLSALDGRLFRWMPSRGLLAALGLIVMMGIGYEVWHSHVSAPELIPPAPLRATAYCPTAMSIGMKFVRIQAGRFTMGSADGDDREKPLHDVAITQPFCLGINEVTVGEWDAVLGPNRAPNPHPRSDVPITSITSEEIEEFLQRLTEKEGRGKYRLPTEAEWEYAARIPGGDVNCRRDRFDGLAPVGYLQPNNAGLRGMLGNVWELVEDWDGLYSAAAAIDPRGPQTGTRRVKRGGGYDSARKHCRATARNSQNPDRRAYDLGFRVLRELE
jgi:hypothetical protein